MPQYPTLPPKKPRSGVTFHSGVSNRWPILNLALNKNLSSEISIDDSQGVDSWGSSTSPLTGGPTKV